MSKEITPERIAELRQLATHDLVDGEYREAIALLDAYEENARLRADLAEAVEALRPFAAWLDKYGADNIAVDAVDAYEVAAAFVAKHKEAGK